MTKKRKMRVQQLPYFLSRTSTLLKEGYTFAECVDMLLPYHVKEYSLWTSVFQQDFEEGAGATVIFQRLGVKKQYLISIELAEESGTLADTLQIVAAQLTFAEQFKQQVQKLLLYPCALFAGIIILFVMFRIKFLPSIQQMMHTRIGNEPAAGIEWSKFFMHTPDYFIIGLLLAAGLGSAFMLYISRKNMAIQLAILLKIPFVRYYYRLKLTRQFARMLGELLLTGFTLQNALEVLMKQPHQPQLSYIARTIQQRVVYGDTLEQAVVLSDFFYSNFHHFIAHGEQSGLLGREMILYAELLEDKIQHMLKTSTKIVQPLLFLVIAVCIVAAYLTILLPMYNMLDVI